MMSSKINVLFDVYVWLSMQGFFDVSLIDEDRAASV